MDTSPEPGPDQVDTVRRFNRTYTPRIGALDDSFLGSGLPLAAARLLFEIGPDGATVRDLRRRTGLDSGYVSRLLRRLEDAGLVELGPDPADRRRRLCRLTVAGRRRWDTLDRRSDAEATDLLAPLSASQRRRLADALATAEVLVRSAALSIEAVEPEGDDAAVALAAYFAELDERFADGFDPTAPVEPLSGDSGTESTDPDEPAGAMTPPNGVFLVARSPAGEIAGCGGLQRHTADTGEIKRMWVSPDWRGAGVGRRLLNELERVAVEFGYGRVVLDTNATLVEAMAMYESAGYTSIERYNDNPYAQRWYAKTVGSDGSSQAERADIAVAKPSPR
jgi:DNA-binding MarR family transcriptional regulator